jgi:hydrogenase-4 component F
MTLLALLAVPLAGALLLLAGPGLRMRRAVHLAAAGLTLVSAAAAVVAVARAGVVTALGGILRADALSAWMVALIALVGGLAALEAAREARATGGIADRRFFSLFHLFVFTMLAAVTTDDVGIMWVAIEGTTLASVFLVNAERSRESLEAAYKYLLICSVGIALAFVGTVLVYFGDVRAIGHADHALRWTTLRELAPALPGRLLHVAFVFLLVGYGTKAGLAPMHTWLPDAHSEAPAPVSALMSGVLLSVGLYAVLRFKVVVDLAGGPAFPSRLLQAVGLASVAVAALFLWRSTNFKRMLAYSSIEHVGLVCLGLGFGGFWGVAGAMLHVANHALAKATLFVLAGRIRGAYGSALIARVRGLREAMPLTARGFLAAMLALMGLPPFGLFVSEIMIVRAGLETGRLAVTVAAVVLLVLAFGGLLRSLHRMLDGEAPRDVGETSTWPSLAPAALALALLVLTGLAWPPGLAAALDRIVAVVGR